MEGGGLEVPSLGPRELYWTEGVVLEMEVGARARAAQCWLCREMGQCNVVKLLLYPFLTFPASLSSCGRTTPTP